MLLTDWLYLLLTVTLYFPHKHNYSGAGLSLVSLENLWPYETYRVRVRCGAQNSFWKWGDWSKEISFQTKMDSKSSVLGC